MVSQSPLSANVQSLKNPAAHGAILFKNAIHFSFCIIFFSILLHSHIYIFSIYAMLNFAKENRMLINSECFWTFDSIDIFFEQL